MDWHYKYIKYKTKYNILYNSLYGGEIKYKELKDFIFENIILQNDSTVDDKKKKYIVYESLITFVKIFSLFHGKYGNPNGPERVYISNFENIYNLKNVSADISNMIESVRDKFVFRDEGSPRETKIRIYIVYLFIDIIKYHLEKNNEKKIIEKYNSINNYGNSNMDVLYGEEDLIDLKNKLKLLEESFNISIKENPVGENVDVSMDEFRKEYVEYFKKVCSGNSDECKQFSEVEKIKCPIDKDIIKIKNGKLMIEDKFIEQYKKIKDRCKDYLKNKKNVQMGESKYETLGTCGDFLNTYMDFINEFHLDEKIIKMIIKKIEKPVNGNNKQIPENVEGIKKDVIPENIEEIENVVKEFLKKDPKNHTNYVKEYYEIAKKITKVLNKYAAIAEIYNNMCDTINLCVKIRITKDASNLHGKDADIISDADSCLFKFKVSSDKKKCKETNFFVIEVTLENIYGHGRSKIVEFKKDNIDIYKYFCYNLILICTNAKKIDDIQKEFIKFEEDVTIDSTDEYMMKENKNAIAKIIQEYIGKLNNSNNDTVYDNLCRKTLSSVNDDLKKKLDDKKNLFKSHYNKKLYFKYFIGDTIGKLKDIMIDKQTTHYHWFKKKSL